MYVAGEGTKRHSELPSNFALPDCVRSRWTWLPLTSSVATAFGWDKFDQKPEAAARELSLCYDAENEATAAIGHRCVGPAGGYKVELRNGVMLRLRFHQKETGEMTTEYRISARWKLPSPTKSLLDSAACSTTSSWRGTWKFHLMKILDISCLVVSLSSSCWLKIVAG